MDSKMEIINFIKELQEDYDKALEESQNRVTEFFQIVLEWITNALLKANIITNDDVNILSSMLEAFVKKYEEKDGTTSKDYEN